MAFAASDADLWKLDEQPPNEAIEYKENSVRLNFGRQENLYEQIRNLSIGPEASRSVWVGLPRLAAFSMGFYARFLQLTLREETFTDLVKNNAWIEIDFLNCELFFKYIIGDIFDSDR